MKSVDPPSIYKASLHSKPHCLRLSSAATPTKASEFRKQSSQSFMPAAKAVPLHEMSASVRACRTQSSTTFQPSRNLSRKGAGRNQFRSASSSLQVPVPGTISRRETWSKQTTALRRGRGRAALCLRQCGVCSVRLSFSVQDVTACKSQPVDHSF